MRKGENWPTFDEWISGKYTCTKDIQQELDLFEQNISKILPTEDFSYRVSRKASVCNKYSFRGLLSKELGVQNLNFARGGSSNQQQFDNLLKLFGDTSKREHWLSQNPVVLWGITSTARIYRNQQSIFLPREYEESHQTDEDRYLKLYTQLYYDHDECVEDLGNNIELVNCLFEKYGIPVLWFDTFNTHKYPNKPRNFLKAGDLLTLMLKYCNIKYKRGWFYHFSDVRSDDPRITAGIENGLLNPYSKHPTKKGHEILYQILYPHVKELYK